MEMVFTFVLSVAAGIVAYYICKWLDDQFKAVSTKNRKPLGSSDTGGLLVCLRVSMETYLHSLILLYALGPKSQARFHILAAPCIACRKPWEGERAWRNGNGLR